MITRPLDLASRLRPEPRGVLALFLVNVGLIGLFFHLFGSAFVLAPGLGVDFALPAVAGANAHARTFTHTITVVNAGQILAGDGRRDMPELAQWLNQQAKSVKNPSLLILANQDVQMSVVTSITGAAEAAGFAPIQYAAIEQEANPVSNPTRR